MGSVLCEQCAAACCRYLAIPLDRPRTRRDYDDIRWYLMHEGVSVFVEDGDWFVQFQARCRNLQPDNRCGVYETRPEICREYEPGDCDYSGADFGYDAFFTHPAQLEAYFARKRGTPLVAQPRKPRAAGSGGSGGRRMSTNGSAGRHAPTRPFPSGCSTPVQLRV